jgi:hypothetical protein
VESLRALLSHAIDYAGLFPPASLPLNESEERYARYLSGSDSWMLARFVCPARRLHELLLPGNNPWRIAVIGSISAGAEQLSTDFVNEQLQQVAAFQESHGTQGTVELFEVSIPDPFATRPELTELKFFVAEFANRIAMLAPKLSSILFELIWLEPWQPRVVAITTALAAVNQQLALDSRPLRVGLKLRMGGATARFSASTSNQIATVIAACRDAELCWKATAGLHHPLGHFDSATGGRVHGFVNLLAAAVLAVTHSLSPTQIEQLLDEERADSFVFRDDGFSWREWRASIEQIRQIRPRSLLSFGSCSFDEPREGLRQLGWLVRNSQ